jgi:hypothetical protein
MIYSLEENPEKIRQIEEAALDEILDAGVSDDLDCLKNLRYALSQLTAKCELVESISAQRVRIANSKEQKELNAEFDKRNQIIETSEPDAQKAREALERNRRAATGS